MLHAGTAGSVRLAGTAPVVPKTEAGATTVRRVHCFAAVELERAAKQ